MKGQVVRSTGSWYEVLTSDNKVYQSRIRGKFRLKNIKHTNPIAVGDWVEVQLDEDDFGVITELYERKNYIIRKSVNLAKRTHIIASNVDQALLIVTIDNPRTSTGFIDRFLVTCEAYQIHPILLFNKIDTLFDADLQLLKDRRALYESIGYQTEQVSALKKIGVDALKGVLKDKVSLVFGHSGVGKTTLVNALSPNLNLKTKDVSNFNKKGQHTTTFAQMFDWEFGGKIIDTPGIKEFGLVDMDKEEIQDYFPEIFKQKENCKFYNCLHMGEPKCAVLDAIEEGEIAESRYESYITFIDEAIENESDYSKS